MLKTRTPNNDIVLSTNILGEDYSSDRDFYNQKLLNFTRNSVVNGVTDSEVYEYKPNNISEINFNIFFLHYVQNNELVELRKYIESGFDAQYNKSKVAFGLTNTSNIEIAKAFNNVYETRQSNGLREEPVLSERSLTKFQALKQKPYVVRDFIGESFLKKPIKSGIPIFYNTFTLPFWPSKDKWLNEPLLFTNKPYFYNSFLLMEVYDSTSITSQNRIQSIPVFVNSRYNITEKNITNNFHYERPCFKLTDGVDGFSFFFMNNYITNEFYVKYSFWDALNGKKISLIPSSNLDANKKWLQDPDNFNQNLRYLKYVLDYDNKTYKIYEYNPITKEYDSERSNFDLYQIEFDSYYKGKIVPNEKPKDSKLSVTTQEILNPLTFTIKNLYTTNFVTDITGKYMTLNNNDISNIPTFLGTTSGFISTFNTYLSSLNTEVFGERTEQNLTLPVLNRNVKTYRVPIKSFISKNVDKKTWIVRNLEFKDISISVNNTVTSNVVYNQRQSLWNEKPSYRVGEALMLLTADQSSNKPTLITSNDSVLFTKKVLTKYMESPVVFKELLSAIERERYSLITYGSSYTENFIANFITNCFKKLGVNFYNSYGHSPKYIGYALNPANISAGQNTNYSEIYFYINTLTEKYTTLKNKNRQQFEQLRDEAVALLSSYKQLTQDENGIVFTVVDKISKVLQPKDNQELIDDFILLTTQKNITAHDKNILINKLTPKTAVANLDTNVSELGYEIRNYAMTMYAIQSGDKFIIPNESNKIDIYFSVGEKVNFVIANASEITIRGKLRLSIIDDTGEIKNIVIPIKSSIKAKIKSDTPKGNTPKYKVEKEPGGGKMKGLNQIV